MSVASFTSRSAMIASTVASDVTHIDVVGIGKYERNDSAIVVAATTNGGSYKWIPSGTVTPDHFGAIGDGNANDTSAWNLANDYIVLKKIPLTGLPGKIYTLTKTTLGGVFKGAGVGNGGLKVHPSIAPNVLWMENRNVPSNSIRTNVEFGIYDCDIDGYNMPINRWLSKADKTPITDPEIDYVMGSGILASGIRDVELLANISNGQVTSISVINGGSGFNGHPTHPYTPNKVSLKIESGGGYGASAWGNISNGSITSVYIKNKGEGYTSAPTVTTMGGYASINLLTTPAIDRRNALYSQTGSGVQFSKCISPRVERVKFKGFKGRTLLDAGCLNSKYREIEFVDCGKNDGPYHCIWIQSYGNPGSTDIWYSPSENILVEDITVYSPERSAIMFNPLKGGTLRRLTSYNAGESSIFAPIAGKEGGSTLIEDCKFFGMTFTDIACQFIETNGVYNMTIRDCYFEGSIADAIGATGGHNLNIHNNTFVNCGQKDVLYPYGPYSERFGYGAGSETMCGTYVNAAAIIQVGVYSDNAGSGVYIENNTVIDTRQDKTKHFLAQTKSGTNNRGTDIVAKNNSFINSGITSIIDTMIPLVWQPSIPLFFGNNLGYIDEGSVVENVTTTATSGIISLKQGFRPSDITFRLTHINGTTERKFNGSISWRRQSPYYTTSGANDYATIGNNCIGYILDNSDNLLYSLHFSKWTEVGIDMTYTRYQTTTLPSAYASISFTSQP